MLSWVWLGYNQGIINSVIVGVDSVLSWVWLGYYQGIIIGVIVGVDRDIRTFHY